MEDQPSGTSAFGQEVQGTMWQRNGVPAGMTRGKDTVSGLGRDGRQRPAMRGPTGLVEGRGVEGRGQGVVTLRRGPGLPLSPGNGEA